MTPTRLLPLAFLAFVATAEADTLYKCTDTAGTVLFTNHKSSAKGCIVISNDSTPSSKPGSKGKSKASSTPTPSSFPKVSGSEQKARDGDRRTILEQELATEQKNLDAAKQANDPARAQLHERNLEALKKEVARLK